MNKFLLTVSVVAMLLVGAPVYADDVLPPDWRGQPGTITAGWGYWGQPGSGPGQIVYMGDQITANPGGFDPMKVGAYAGWNSSVSVHDVVQGRQSVLEVNPGGGMGPVGFGLVNYDNDNPLKNIRIQITFLLSGVMDFYVVSDTTDPGDPPWPTFPFTKIDAVVADSVTHDDGWTTSAYDLTIEPNPSWEGISLDWGFNTGPQTWTCFIDQVVIDTQCVPEPATMIFLISGGLMLLGYAWRRRRKTV